MLVDPSAPVSDADAAANAAAAAAAPSSGAVRDFSTELSAAAKRRRYAAVGLAALLLLLAGGVAVGVVLGSHWRSSESSSSSTSASASASPSVDSSAALSDPSGLGRSSDVDPAQDATNADAAADASEEADAADLEELVGAFDPNKCPNHPCENGGTCNPTKRTCDCPPAYRTAYCINHIGGGGGTTPPPPPPPATNPCASHPCGGYGTCQANGASFTCACPPTFTGPTCQTPVNTNPNPQQPTGCAANPTQCGSNGQCQDVGNGQTHCNCLNGFTGSTCSTPPTPPPSPSGGGSSSGAGAPVPCRQADAGCQPIMPEDDCIQYVTDVQMGGAGRYLPPANAPLSAAYTDKWPQPYQVMQQGECSKDIHDLFWVYGPDGKVYPTWHPPVFRAAGYVCYFGHEHGDNPSGSVFKNEALPFGLTNEMYAQDSRAQQYLVSQGSLPSARNEDHVGHKVVYVNGGRAMLDATHVESTCDALMKVHQGVHSQDAFINSLHEIFFRMKCSSDKREVKVKTLQNFGAAGGAQGSCGPRTEQFIATEQGFGGDFAHVGLTGSRRRVPDVQCVQESIVQNSISNFAAGILEHWTFDCHPSWSFDNQNSGSFAFNPYLFSLNPARYLDDTRTRDQVTGHEQDAYLRRYVDLCAAGTAHGDACDTIKQRSGSATIDWQSVYSPFIGTLRQFSPNRIFLSVTGTSTVYLDALGMNPSRTPFPNSLEQYFVSDPSIVQAKSDLFFPFKDFGVYPPQEVNFGWQISDNTNTRIHSPN